MCWDRLIECETDLTTQRQPARVTEPATAPVDEDDMAPVPAASQ